MAFHKVKTTTKGKKVNKKKIDSTSRNRKLWTLFFLLILFLIALPLTVYIVQKQTTILQHASTLPDLSSQNAILSSNNNIPTYNCLGACPTGTQSQTPSQSLSPSSGGSQPNVSEQPSTAPVVSPCNSTQSISTRTESTSSNSNNNFLILILQFLLKLLQLMFGLTPSPSSPCPTPSIPVSQVSPSATTSNAPNPSSAPTNGGTNPTTAPVTTSSCTNPVWSTSAEFGTWSNGGYTLNNNRWGGGTGTQTIYACAYNNWYVVSTQPNTGGVKTYPEVVKSFDKPISSFTSISSTFGDSGPTSGSNNWEAAYDIWANGMGSGSTEVMIWNDTHDEQPAGSQVTTATIGGKDYEVWKYQANGKTDVSFVMSTNETSGTVNILAFFSWLSTEGWLTNPTLSTIDYGFEVRSTNNIAQTFKVTAYSVTSN